MNQRDINQAEWENPENWSDCFWGVYFSRKDTRVWVPKKIQWMGWTLNLARPAGVIWMFVILLSPFFILLGITILTSGMS